MSSTSGSLPSTRFISLLHSGPVPGGPGCLLHLHLVSKSGSFVLKPPASGGGLTRFFCPSLSHVMNCSLLDLHLRFYAPFRKSVVRMAKLHQPLPAWFHLQSCKQFFFLGRGAQKSPEKLPHDWKGTKPIRHQKAEPSAIRQEAVSESAQSGRI